MDDKDLFEQLERGPLIRNGFDETLRRRINESLDKPKQKSGLPWFVRWRSLSAAFLVIVAVIIGLWSWRGSNLAESDKLSLPTEQASASLQVTDKRDINPIPHSAVVIGLREDHNQASSSYRTILVAPVNEELQVIGSGTGIWMPYKTNFWRIDVVSDKYNDGNQLLRASRAAQQKQVIGQAEEQLPFNRTEKLLYAGNRFVSIMQSTNVNENGIQVDHSQVWVNELPTLAERGDNQNALEDGHFTLSKALNTEDAATDIDQWVITRESGKWVAKQPVKALSNTSIPEIQSWPTVIANLTKDIVKDDPLALSWAEVQQLEPTAIDAYTSQDEDVAVIVTNNNIQLIPYQLPEEERQPVTVNISPNETVVMVQWATQEKYVDTWKLWFSKWFAASAK